MDTLVIVNPSSGGAEDFGAMVGRLGGRSGVEVNYTTGSGDAATFARRALDTKARRVIIVGGDGTLNEVVNVFAEADEPPAVAIVPAGTGNDFGRTLRLPDTPQEAEAWLNGPCRAIQVDLLKVSWPGGHRWAINAVHGGYAMEVTEDVDADRKKQLGPFAYLAAVPDSWAQRESYETHLRWEDGTKDVVDAIDLVLANGHSVGGGFPVDTTADPTDGVFECIAVRPGSVLNLAGVAADLASGDLIDSEYVLQRSVTSVHVESDPPMGFNVDGEPIDADVIDVEIEPGVLTVQVPDRPE